MEDREFTVRPAVASDAGPVIDLYEAVASEGKWIGGEAPVDRERLESNFVPAFISPQEPGTMMVAEARGGQVVGNVGMQSHGGIAELGMMVADGWRGHGVGTALMKAAIAWAREAGLHKVALQVWPHNEAARRLYRSFGFVEEGYLRRHYRRRSGELWDAVMMALVLDTSSPGSPHHARC